MDWLRISLLLCFFGFLKEQRPSEPFVSEFLQEPHRNVTSDELNRYVYPTGTYTTGVLSIVVLLVTDLLRYKPIIIFLGIAGIITWSLLLWTTTLATAILLEVFYAAYITCEVSYFAYIYAKVAKEHYLAVTSHTRAALLAGRFVSSTLAQTLRSFELMDIRQLNYISLGAQIAATLFALGLPSVKKSIYFYRDNENDCSRLDNIENLPRNLNLKATGNGKYRKAFKLMWHQFRSAYSNRQVLLWSVWYAFGLCGFLQVTTYIQIVWIEIDNRPEVIWNGAVDAITGLLSAVVALLASRLHTSVLNTQTKVLWSLFAMSLCASAAIFLAANGAQRYISYIGYTVFYLFYSFTITISSAEIAKQLPEDSYGLIFGINTCLAYWLQIILTVIVVSGPLNLTIFEQFNVYGAYFIALGCIYFALVVIGGIRSIADSKVKKSIDLNDSS